MASYEVEISFVGRFVGACYAGDKAAWQALEVVQPGMLQNTMLDHRFGQISGRFACGDSPFDPDDPIDDIRNDIFDESFTAEGLASLAERVRNDWRSREQVRLLTLGLHEADKAVGSPNGKAKRIADKLSMALLNLFADGAENGQPRNLEEILDAELALMASGEDHGVTLPYPKLEEACGPWMPGDLIALPAFSGGGKSTLASNLVLRWIRRGVPVIAFPTEMKQLWVARMLAAHAGIRQWVVEKRQWKRARYEEMQEYQAAVAEMRTMPFQVVNRANPTPTEIMAAVRVLRRRWTGQTVVVVIDHMHRLNYEGEDPNKGVGPATKLIKDFASEDSQGGLVFLLLYQPRKPQGDTYRPIAAYEIRGDSTVWNEVDTCLSPYRVWVKTEPGRETRWHTPLAKVDPSGRPVLAKPEAEGAKLSDEHVFVKVDKRRVGGEGPTIFLNYEGPSGNIYENFDQ